MLHKMIDIYKCHNPKFNNMMGINNLINDICVKLELEPIAPPTIIPFYYGKVVEDDGISAFVLLKGGHFTIHTFYKRRCAFIDLLFDDFEGVVLEKLLIHHGYFKEKKIKINAREVDRNCKNSLININKMNKFDEDIENNFAGFGPHYMVTATVKEDLTFEQIYSILDKMPYLAEMTPITRPFIIKDKIVNANYISGIIIIAESHIAIHFDKVNKKLYFDLFTCRPLPADKIKSAFLEQFNHLIDYGQPILDVLIERGQDHVYAINKKKTSKFRTNWKKGTWIENIGLPVKK